MKKTMLPGSHTGHQPPLTHHPPTHGCKGRSNEKRNAALRSLSNGASNDTLERAI